MSQHLFPTTHAGRQVQVTMGWDRPLQGFFMLIEFQEAKDGDYLYLNLDDESLEKHGGLPPTLEPFLSKLDELHIQVPEQMIAQVRADARTNTGNRYVSYGADGNAIERTGRAA